MQIIIYGTISGLALIIGAAIGIWLKLSRRAIAHFMAFGSGVLICAMTFGLLEEAFNHGGHSAVTIGFVSGGLAFIGFDYLIHLGGGRKHKNQHIISDNVESSGRLIVLGSILDGIPESIALGIALASSQGRGALMLIAIVLSNFPEGISSVTGLRKEGFNNKRIFSLWGSVATLTLVFAIFSYTFLSAINPDSIGILEAFAAGSILAMLADSMMPEAYKEGGPSIGLLTILGFLTAFIVSRL